MRLSKPFLPFARTAILLGILALVLSGVALGTVNAVNASPAISTNANPAALGACSVQMLLAQGASDFLRVLNFQRATDTIQPLFKALPTPMVNGLQQKTAVQSTLFALIDPRWQLWLSARDFTGTVLNCMNAFRLPS